MLAEQINNINMKFMFRTLRALCGVALIVVSACTSSSRSTSPATSSVPSHGRAVATFLRDGRNELNQGELDQAITNFSKAIELRPTSWTPYQLRGEAEHRKGDLDAAIADFTKAIELNPGASDSFLGRGSVKIAKQDPDGAIADIAKSVELSPNASAYEYLAKIKSAKGDIVGADEAAAKAHDLEEKPYRLIPSKTNPHEGVVVPRSAPADLTWDFADATALGQYILGGGSAWGASSASGKWNDMVIGAAVMGARYDGPPANKVLIVP